jgi:hypothetical protein
MKNQDSPSMICRLKKGQRFTHDRDMAIKVALMTGMKPIAYISPDLRPVFLKAYPEMGIQMKKKRAKV